MHPRFVLAIARKDALDILLNKSTLTLLLTPIMLAVLFFVVGKLLGSHTTNILIYNPGRSSIEQTVTGSFTNVAVTYANSPEHVVSAFGPDGSHKNTTYALGLVVPNNFDTSIQAKQYPQVGLYTNGDQVSTIQKQLVLSAMSDYSRNRADPQLPITLSVATVNPPTPSSNLLDITQIYSVALVLGSLFIGSALVPGLLAEEKEKKTLRMLMVSPASFSDVVIAKLLVGLVYQLVLILLALTLEGGFIGNVPLLLLFVLLGALFSIAVGLVIGCFFQTTNATGAAGGMISFLYIIPIFFVGPFAQLFASALFPLIKILPTYYIASGVSDAISNQNTFAGVLLNAGILGGIIVALFVFAVWILRRQAIVTATA